MAAAGSTVSSTAVTASLANRMPDAPDDTVLLNAGIAAASVVMFMRLMALVALLAPFALVHLAMLAAPGLAVSLIATAVLLRQARHVARKEHEPVDVQNPADLKPALLLVGFVMVMTLAARWVLGRYGDQGLAVVLAVSGTVDVDSAVITMGSLPKGSLSPHMGGLVLLAPMVLNTLFKAGIAISIGGWSHARAGALTLAASALASLAAVPLVIQ